MERLSLMSKNLTAQQLADELGVTRQLIYYHAKKLPPQEKIYDNDNTLVFSPSQQNVISSYMTDTIKDTKNETQHKNTNDVKANALTHSEGQKARIIQTKQVTNKATNSLSNVKTASLTESLSKEKEEEALSTETNDANQEPDNNKEQREVSVSNTENTNRSESVKMYIQQVLRDQVGALYPVQQQEQMNEKLFAELEEKNQQISTLHKLLDQQQQLAIIAEQKHQKLLDTLGVEDIKQLEQIVKQAAIKLEEDSEVTPAPEPTVHSDSQEKKSWFQRIFG